MIDHVGLSLADLSVSRDGLLLVQDASLSIGPGELHVLSGVNGSGKSTLLNAVAGHPAYVVEKGSIVIDGSDVTNAPVHERALAGLFLALQHPPVIAGVTVRDFLRSSLRARQGDDFREDDFRVRLTQAAAELRLDPGLLDRSVNEGFSGGERKRSEMLQMMILQPKYALLDEPDSGLDQDAVPHVAEVIAKLRQAGTGFLVVTHSQQFMDLLQPSQTHRFVTGRIV